MKGIFVWSLRYFLLLKNINYILPWSMDAHYWKSVQVQCQHMWQISLYSSSWYTNICNVSFVGEVKTWIQVTGISGSSHMHDSAHHLWFLYRALQLFFTSHCAMVYVGLQYLSVYLYGQYSNIELLHDKKLFPNNVSELYYLYSCITWLFK